MAASVAGIEVVPVADTFLGRVPAEEDDASIPLVREVEEALIKILQDDAELPDAFYIQVEVVRFEAVIGAASPAAVSDCGPQDRLHVRCLLAQGVAVERDVGQDLAQRWE